MDRNQRSYHGRRRQRPSAQNSTPAQQAQQRQQPSSRNARPTSYMNTAPPPQWQDIPLPHRLRDFDRYRYYTVPESLYWWRQRPYEEPQANRTVQQPPGSLVNTLGSEESGTGDLDMDISSFHPQTGPNFSRLNASDDMERAYRTVSQPNTPFVRHDEPQSQALVPSSMTLLPRSPTYPPATGRRARSASNLPDATFSDVEDFHLFVQATAGLGPEQAFRLSNSPSSHSSEYGGTSADQDQMVQPSGSEQQISPVQETPTTMHALQQLAQMPQDVHAIGFQQRGSLQVSTSQGQTGASARADSWLDLPEDYDEDYDEGAIDEELPDYAMSQAQAQAAQRIEATRRAQELQRRWQQSR